MITKYMLFDFPFQKRGSHYPYFTHDVSPLSLGGRGMG